jgi:hypothetical protein
VLRGCQLGWARTSDQHARLSLSGTARTLASYQSAAQQCKISRRKTAARRVLSAREREQRNALTPPGAYASLHAFQRG